jgi:G:T-mismatch repair DNA endonuclease (very short patch repair protein)
MDNKYQFDFLIKDRNIIIETHGDYWHANPNIYSDLDSTKKNLNDQQRYKVILDNEKLIYLKERNYEIIYLWETEIKNTDYKKILKEWNL